MPKLLTYHVCNGVSYLRNMFTYIITSKITPDLAEGWMYKIKEKKKRICMLIYYPGK